MGDDVESEARERVGSVLNDKWALERVLGVGGMAAVYAARHRNGARAAVKVLHADLSRNAQVRERFLREGYAANRVEHPGVVKVLDDDVVAGGPDAGTAYLVMELLEGQSLQERLERGPPVGEREFLLIAASVLEVLEAAHARGVVHRDLKPENLFLVRDVEGDDRPPGSRPRLPVAGASEGVRVKVLDFGLARVEEGQAITSYGLALGTPSFMAPEQAAGRTDEIDGRTDLFALAATGFRLRTGRRIHEGVNPVELVTKMAHVAAPPIRSVVPSVTAAFAAVIDRALKFRREDRYENATAMYEAVRSAIAKLDAGFSVTEMAIPVQAFAPPAGEGTIEASQSDFEPSLATRTSPGPSAPRPDTVSPVSHRRSLLVLVTIFVVGSAGAKLWFDARFDSARRGAVRPDAVPTDAADPVHDSGSPAIVATTFGGASGGPGGQRNDGGEQAVPDASTDESATAASSVPHTTPAAPSSSASAPRHPQPARAGAGGKVRTPAAIHHGHPTGPKSGHP